MIWGCTLKRGLSFGTNHLVLFSNVIWSFMLAYLLQLSDESISLLYYILWYLPHFTTKKPAPAIFFINPHSQDLFPFIPFSFPLLNVVHFNILFWVIKAKVTDPLIPNPAFSLSCYFFLGCCFWLNNDHYAIILTDRLDYLLN